MGTFTVTSSVGGNKKPITGNYNLLLDNRESKVLTSAMFTTNTSPAYFDSDGDPALTVLIGTIALSGQLLYASSPVTQGLEVLISDIDLGLLTYIAPDVDNWSTGHFFFNIGNGQYADTEGKFGISNNLLEVPLNLPPTVSPNNAALAENTYQFQLPDFIKDFADENGDSYEKVKIETLPTIGSLYYSDVLVEIGFEFPLSGILNLEFRMPGNIQVTANGYCEYTQDIDTIVSTYQTNGYTLKLPIGQNLTFTKEVTDGIPNDTDIYAFFDATSMKIADAQAAKDALVLWYDDYVLNNPLFTGVLYILPVVKENWLDFPIVLLRGSSSAVKNNPDRPADDFMALAVIPPNFDTASNDVNLAWTSPTKILTLAFIDEAEGGAAAYHLNRNGYGFQSQPMTQYLTDYKNFVDSYSQFEFFQGIFYPIPNIATGSYNNIYNACVLQGFAAIEGGATYTLAEITGLGVTYAEQRRFHWHLDPNNANYTGSDPYVANPYSAEAQTPVPGTTYELQGLKDFGWAGVYNKDQPASAVFTSNSFATELNGYLGTGQTTYIDTQIVEGDCTTGIDTCFQFATSDDSVDNLYSFPVDFCFSDLNSAGGIINTAPTVSSNSAALRLVEYTFGNFSFVRDYTDAEGHPATTVTIKTLPRLGNLIYKGNIINIGARIPVTDALLLKYQLEDRYAIYNGIIYDFTSSIDIIITGYISSGYTLTSNVNGILTFQSANGEIKVNGTRISTQVAFDFTTSDSTGLDSNIATFTLVPEGNINVKPAGANQPPTVGNNTLQRAEGEDIIFTRAHFIEDTDPRFSDPEGDQPFMLKVLTLPQYGTLMLDTVAVTVNQEITFVDIDAGLFHIVSPVVGSLVTSIEFEFTVSDTGSKQYA